MATVAEIADTLALTVLTRTANLSADITGGYASDLLSCVMARAQAGNVWVTLQSHVNVVAVASLLNLACVVITEGAAVDQATLDKAEEAGIALLSTPMTTFSVVEQLHDVGVAGVG